LRVCIKTILQFLFTFELYAHTSIFNYIVLRCGDISSFEIKEESA